MCLLTLKMTTTLHDLPLDAWVGIFRAFPLADRVSHFNMLRSCGIFAGMNRLDTFWTIISRLEKTEHPAPFEEFPDVTCYHSAAEALIDMGISPEVARTAVGRACGDLQTAMHYLGWT